MKLSGKLNRLINESLSSPSDTAWQPIWKVLDSAVDKLNEPDLMIGMREWGRYDHLTDTQWLVVRFSESEGLEPEAAINDGITRRLWKDAPSELALRLAMGARFQSIVTQVIAHQHFDALWRNILQAAAAHDWFAVDRLCQLWRTSDEKPNSRTYALICNGIDALYSSDTSSLQEVADSVEGRKAPAYVKAVMTAIAALARRDAVAFNESLCIMLKRYKSYMYGDELSGLIDVHAIGLFELASRYCNKTTSAFDRTSKLPWDSEYSDWLCRNESIDVLFEIPDGPSWLLSSMFRMEQLDWAPKIRREWDIRLR